MTNYIGIIFLLRPRDSKIAFTSNLENELRFIYRNSDHTENLNEIYSDRFDLIDFW